MRQYLLVVACLAWITIESSMAHADDWLRFRGPNGSGISTETVSVPTTWSETENLKWKVSLPGPGSSSPIVVGDKVFVTCWSGYGVDRGTPGNQEDLKRHLFCLDRNTGKTIWSKEVAAYLPEDEYGGMFAEHGYASHTPVSDGENVYVFFGKTGALAFDLSGQQLWQRNCGTESGDKNWGSSSSPILYKDLVIIPATAESEAVVALNKKTGEEVWRQEASGFRGTWGSPILVKIDDSRTDLVLGVPYEIWGFNPETGKLRWFTECPVGSSFCSSLVADGQVIYGGETGPGGGGSIAVKAGGTGDVKANNILWTNGEAGRICTPIVHDDRFYYFSGTIANCLNASNGERVYQTRLSGGGSAAPPAAGEGRPPGGGGPGGGRGFGGGRGGMGGQNYASPILADGKIYFQTRSGGMYVIKTGDKFEQLALNKVTSDNEDFSATPAVSNGELFIRSSKYVYCVGKK